MGKLIGAKAHSARLLKLTGPSAAVELGRALYVGGSMIAVQAQTSITAGSVSGKGHVPSLPGQPPNANTRVLDLHIIVDQVSALFVRVISQAPYSVDLEYGTAKMAARPYMRPATAAKRAAAVELVRQSVQRLIAASKV